MFTSLMELPSAATDEQILSAAKEDNEELYLEAIEQEHDINHQDGYVDHRSFAVSLEYRSNMACPTAPDMDHLVWGTRVCLATLTRCTTDIQPH